MTFIIAMIGALVYRVRGMGLWPGRPWWQLLFALPFAAVTYGIDPWAALVVLGLTTGATVSGHASYQSMGTPGYIARDGNRDEWYGKWLSRLHLSNFWHDYLGMTISGLLITSSAGIVLVMCGQLYAGLVVIASGALKAPAYVIAWVTYRKWGGDPIRVAEVITGAALWGSLYAIV